MVHYITRRSLSPRHGRPQVADGGTASNMAGSCANILNKQSRTADEGWSSSWGIKTHHVTKCSHRKPRTCIDTLVRPKDRDR